MTNIKETHLFRKKKKKLEIRACVEKKVVPWKRDPSYITKIYFSSLRSIVLKKKISFETWRTSPVHL